MPYPAVCFSLKGGTGGYAPCKSISASFHLEESWGNGACEGTQAVLAILLQITRREFACCVSLGEQFATHRCVTALITDSLGNPASQSGRSNKKTATAHKGMNCPQKLHSSLCDFLLFFDFIHENFIN